MNARSAVIFSMGIFLVTLTLSFFPWAEKGARAAELSEAQIKPHLKEWIDRGFNLDEKGAVGEMMKAVELDRENPLGYAFLALSNLFFYESSFGEKEREKNQESMLRFVSKALISAVSIFSFVARETPVSTSSGIFRPRRCWTISVTPRYPILTGF